MTLRGTQSKTRKTISLETQLGEAFTNVIMFPPHGSGVSRHDEGRVRGRGRETGGWTEQSQSAQCLSHPLSLYFSPSILALSPLSPRNIPSQPSSLRKLFWFFPGPVRTDRERQRERGTLLQHHIVNGCQAKQPVARQAAGRHGSGGMV